MAQVFRLDYAGLGEYLVSEEMLKMVRVEAEKRLLVAELIAPEYTGEYRTKFEVTVDVRGGKHPRAAATLKNTSDHAFRVEFGGKNTPRHRTLGKAIGAAE